MATRVVSEVQAIGHDIATVYAVLSDFNRLGELLKTFAPPPGQLSPRIQEVRTTTDTCTLVVTGIGEIGARIEEREAPVLVKLGHDGKTPFDFNLWVQLKEHAPGDTRMRLTLEARLNAMLQVMLKGKLDAAINQLAVALARLPYATAR
jgi:carbon monoxide dehydrogenase subunit G